MSAPWLSVVMPCLNAGGTISRSLDSITSQNCPGVETVVVDGGSTDGTLDRLAGRPEVRWESAPDQGLSDAFNKGAERARGEVLGWLNADDIYLPGALTAVRAAFRDDPELVWLTGRCVIVDGAGRPIRRGVSRYKNALLSRYSHRVHLTHNFVAAPSTFFRRDAFHASGGMDLTLRYSMDYDLYLRFGRTSRPRVLGQELAAFTMAEGTLSMSGFEQQFVEHYEVARRYRADGAPSVIVNRGLSACIVLAYKGMRRLERFGTPTR